MASVWWRDPSACRPPAVEAQLAAFEPEHASGPDAHAEVIEATINTRFALGDRLLDRITLATVRLAKVEDAVLAKAFREELVVVPAAQSGSTNEVGEA